MVESSRLERVAVVCFERDTRGSNKSSSRLENLTFSAVLPTLGARARSAGSELGRDFLPAHKSFDTSLIVLKGTVSCKYIKVKGLGETVGLNLESREGDKLAELRCERKALRALVFRRS